MDTAAAGWDIRVTNRCHVEKSGDLGADGSPCHFRVNEYELLSKLGEGSFGKVFLAERRVPGGAPRKFALKVMKKSVLRKQKELKRVGTSTVAVSAWDRVMREVAVWRTLYHRHCVLLFEVIDDPDSNKLYLVTEFMDGGQTLDVKNVLPAVPPADAAVGGGGGGGGGDGAVAAGMVPAAPMLQMKFHSAHTHAPYVGESTAQRYLYGLMRGLEYLHGRRVAHLDIKPENLLVSDTGRCLIADFGCAVEVPEAPADAGGPGPPPTSSGDLEDGMPPLPDEIPPGKALATEGTPAFYAPECCAGHAYDPFPADVWAAGATLYCFLFGRLPFWKRSRYELFESIMHDEPSYDWRPVDRPWLQPGPSAVAAPELPPSSSAPPADGAPPPPPSGPPSGFRAAGAPPPPPSGPPSGFRAASGAGSAPDDATTPPSGPPTVGHAAGGSGTVPADVHEPPSADAVALLRRLLHKDPCRRPTPREVLALPWLAAAASADPPGVVPQGS